jgi:hypothetical protein
MDALLDELCVKYGWCLGPDDRAGLLQADAPDAEAIADAIVDGELGDADVCDAKTRRWLIAMIDDWLFDPSGRGAGSGLPDRP